MLLDGKSVVVTGAGSGVGRASALLFAAEGAQVVCADVREDWAAETVRQIAEAAAEAPGAKGTGVALRCDVTVAADVDAAVAAAVERFGRLDVMFNNAGIATPVFGMRTEDHTLDQIDALLAVNIRGIVLGCQAAVRQFRAQGGGGVIVNTGSVAGMVGWGGTVYGATKGAVNQLTRGVAVECAADDIRVNAICPAAMPATNFMVPDASTGSQGIAEEEARAVGAAHPLGRPITAEDCAAAALFLASDAARNITGVLLPVDGGFVAQ
ncbi:SDR family NAD(P)-dependent oxidoreductase [Yinghuangia sp. YIM S09857]|uniref:SDR family NAD(P)-dependent oxidoreductase n=1 Tax=Yinghuangia sp. YIM S09857 TaxID=3436929 RepID=UPI003F52BF1D